MSEQKRECEFCELAFYELPRTSDGTLMDVMIYCEPAIDVKNDWARMVVEDGASGSTAVFNINYCPMCGKELMHQ